MLPPHSDCNAGQASFHFNAAASRRERERASSPPDRIDIFGRTVSKRSSLDEKQKREEEEKKAEFERQRKM